MPIEVQKYPTCSFAYLYPDSLQSGDSRPVNFATGVPRTCRVVCLKNDPPLHARAERNDKLHLRIPVASHEIQQIGRSVSSAYVRNAAKQRKRSGLAVLCNGSIW